MTYIINTNDATKLREMILTYVEKKKDPKGSEIRSWDVTTPKDSKEKVLIHTTDQWEEKGNLHLKCSKDNKEIEVYFRYWSGYPEKDRSGNEAEYLFGRFTELLLVHFWNKDISVTIA